MIRCYYKNKLSYDGWNHECKGNEKVAPSKKQYAT